jgi:hypothetical protein
LLNDRVTFIAFNMGDETNAAGIMLVGWVVQAMLFEVLNFGFDALLVFHSELFMGIEGIGQRLDGGFVRHSSGGQAFRFVIHRRPWSASLQIRLQCHGGTTW